MYHVQVAGHQETDGTGSTFVDAEGRLHKATKRDERSEREWAFYLFATQCRRVATPEAQDQQESGAQNGSSKCVLRNF